MRPGHHVLEVGAGTGYNATLLTPAAGPARGDLASAARAERGHDVAAWVLRVTLPGFLIVFVIAQLLVYAVGFLALRAGRGHTRRRRMLGLARALALLGAAVPAATYLVNLAPWWQAAHPAMALFGGVVAGAAVITGVALARPWRRDVMVPGTIVAGITAVLLGTDLTAAGLSANWALILVFLRCRPWTSSGDGSSGPRRERLSPPALRAGARAARRRHTGGRSLARRHR